MKLDRNLRSDEIEEKINSLLLDVNLLSCSNIKIGSVDNKKVLSGGEKKRLAFATEVMCLSQLILRRFPIFDE